MSNDGVLVPLPMLSGMKVDSNSKPVDAKSEGKGRHDFSTCSQPGVPSPNEGGG